MYAVGPNDTVVELADMPGPSTGAPLPALVVTEGNLLLSYRAAANPPGWDGTRPISVSRKTPSRLLRIRFERAVSHMFGAPNDEVLAGHPLYERGLRHYGAYEVKDSSWIRALEEMNSVHPSHSSNIFRSCRHFIITFHDSTFECVANGYQVTEHDGSLRSALAEMANAAGNELA